MVAYTGVWSAAQVTEYLDRVTVPLRLACRTPADRLWMVSLWYRFRDDAFHCATSARADVVRYLHRDPDVAFEVSTNEPPYTGVRGNGTASVEPDRGKAILRGLLERYLGGTDSPLADRLLAEGRDEVTVRIEPDRLFSWDFSARMSDVAGERA